MLRMRLSLDCGCAAVATQGGSDNLFTVESLAALMLETLGQVLKRQKPRNGPVAQLSAAIVELASFSESRVTAICGGRPLRSHPELYLVPQTNTGAFGAGHLNLAIVEQIPARRLMDDQSMRLYNLNPARGGSRVFWVVLNNGGDAYEFKDQVARRFVWSERINRFDHHFDLCHSLEKYQNWRI